MSEFKEGDNVYCLSYVVKKCTVKEVHEDNFFVIIAPDGHRILCGKDSAFHRLEDLLGHLVKDLPEAKNIRITL